MAAAFLVWVFVWDDDIDLGDTKIATDKCEASNYCQESLAYARWALGLDAAGHTLPECSFPSMMLFRDFGHGLCEVMDRGWRPHKHID